MPRLAAVCLSILFAVPTTVAAAVVEQPGVTTHRSAGAFRDCFIASQDQAKRPWAYVLNGDSGGTFSTVPMADGDSPYFLSVRERDGARSITLSGEAVPGSGATIATAVDGCVR
jgi:hypothetical protein